MAQTLNLEAESKILSKIEGGIIPLVELTEFWPQICYELDKIPFIWETHWTKEALYECVMVGRYQVWGFGEPGFINVMVFTEIVNFPANKILRIPIIFGNSLDQALPMMEAIILDRYAVEAGCAFCEAVGRVGWERKVPRFKKVASLLRCEIKKRELH